MAIRLSAWLEETFESQLLLGNQWLQDKHEKKNSRIQAQLFNRQWDVYHDNGSSLDIINYLDSERNSALQVLKISPLTLTDGQHQIISHLTSDCARDFFKRSPTTSHLTAGTAIAARKYTVRLTSYGPPRERLRLILNRIDWLGESCERAQDPNTQSPRPLHVCEQIGVLLEQLCRIRSLQDSRCLTSGAEEAEVEAVDDATAHVMGPHTNRPHGNGLHSQTQGTQLPFGTQIRPLSRTDGSEDDIQVVGVNRLEPVLAGNTQRTEIRPGAANFDYEQRMGLLSLLGVVKKPSASKSATTSAPGFVQSAFGKQPSDATPAADEPPKVSSDASHQQSTRSEVEVEKADTASSILNREKKRVKKVRDISPESPKAAKDLRIEEQDIQQDLIEHGSDTIPECPWMKGLIFNSETLKVPQHQRECLGKETSWLKPQPGVPPFQDGNMPQTILTAIHRMADERAGLEIDSDSDLDPSPDSLDPSPESRLQKTQDDEPATTQEDDTNSQVTWEASPEPPEHPTRSPQGLPPDSSIERQASHSEHESPAPPMPTSKQSHHSAAIDISDSDEPVGPASSPPAPAASADSDEEMEMEESVPQALGEDLAQQTQPPSTSDKLPESIPVQSPVVVQVKETPYGKSKKAPDTVSGQTSNTVQSSSGEPKQTSSTSIVHSTYDTPSLSDLAELGIIENAKDLPADVEEGNPGTKHEAFEVSSGVAEKRNGDHSGDTEMPDNITNAEHLKEATDHQTAAAQQSQHNLAAGTKLMSTLLATPKPPQLPPKSDGAETSSVEPHLVSQSTKRKLVTSPTKSSRRQSKRREIKIVGFGDDAPGTVDPIAAMRRDREESLRIFREQRNSSTSFDSRPDPTSRLTAEQDSDAMDIDGGVEVKSREPSPSMSPRHRDLYDAPSSIKAQPATSLSSRLSITDLQSKDRSSNTQIRGPVPLPAQPRPASSEEGDQDDNMTIFQSFTAAYPEYDGNERHFQNQCMHMYQLEQEDKMVPKWQWDDFIIRNRTEYRQYAMDCVGQGEDPEPYHRFYKDNIRDTLYKKGIIENIKILKRALEELGAAPATSVNEPSVAYAESGIPRQPGQPTQKPEPTRKSLPGGFNQPKKHALDRVNGTSSRPRHSLPTNPRFHAQSPRRPTSSASASSSRPQPRHSNPTERVSATRPTPQRPSIPSHDGTTDPTADAEASTGDRYRDFVFGLQRSTSWTGSTKVDPRKPWPQSLAGRPSIADAPRTKVDVLDWGDVLGKTGWRGEN